MEFNVMPLAALLLAASGFTLVWAMPFKHLLKERVSDFVVGTILTVLLGSATWACFAEEEVGAVTFVGIVIAFAFGLVLGTVVRTVVTMIRE